MADACVDCGRTDTVFFTSGCSGCKTVSEWPAMPLEQPRDEPTTIEKLEALVRKRKAAVLFPWLGPNNRVHSYPAKPEALQAAINAAYEEMRGE